MNDDFYKDIQSRLLADRLIGRSVAQLRDRQAQERQELEFRYSQETTDLRQRVNNYVHNLGEHDV